MTLIFLTVSIKVITVWKSKSMNVWRDFCSLFIEHLAKIQFYNCLCSIYCLCSFSLHSLLNSNITSSVVSAFVLNTAFCPFSATTKILNHYIASGPGNIWHIDRRVWWLCEWKTLQKNYCEIKKRIKIMQNL